MEYVPNYNDSSDFVGGEFWTKETFLYGSFECKASFANQLGSWPAFWSFHKLPCPNNEGPEIDFAEYSCRVLNGTSTIRELGHYIHHWLDAPCGQLGGETATDYNYNYGFTSTTNVFKCIWTPEKIDFYVDDVKKVTYYNNGTDWYPANPVSVILSQQITQPFTILGQPTNPVYPQTSYFDYVKVRQFFLAPQITCPDTICSSSSASLDVDSEALNISWSLSPAGLFTGATSGTGKNVSINVGSANGKGKITYTFEMPSGEEFEVDKSFWVGAPVISQITGPMNTPNGQWASYHAVLESELSSPTDYNWILNPLNGNSVYDYGDDVDIAFYNPGSYQLVVQAKNTCSDPNYGPYYVTGIYVYETYSLSFSPNPTTGETTLTIESGAESETLKSVSVGEDTFDDNAEWDMEIYSPMQALQTKKTNLKGNSTTIQTAGWMEGVYTVRVKYKDEILTGKLIVKR